MFRILILLTILSCAHAKNENDITNAANNLSAAVSHLEILKSTLPYYLDAKNVSQEEKNKLALELLKLSNESQKLMDTVQTWLQKLPAEERTRIQKKQIGM